MGEARPHNAPPHDASGLAVVVTGGAPLPPEAVTIIDRAQFVVAADSGLDHLLALQRRPHLVVGDMDSVSSAALQELHHLNLPVETHPRDKDATDTELALDTAARHGYRSITLLSGGGDRLDHIMGWMGVLADQRWAHLSRVDAWCGTTHVQVLHGTRHLGWYEAELDAVVSLLPLAGRCSGVTTSGLRWRLDDAVLSATSSRGISNTVAEHRVSVGLRSGALAIIRPHRSMTAANTVSPTPQGGTHDQ